MGQSTTPGHPMPAYVPPQPAFTPCAFCGCPVALGRDAAGHAIAVSPVLGDEHLCGENCACALQKGDE